MGKPTGFIEYLRELPVDRTPTERVRDWKEFHHHMEEKKLRQQGARCMDCGVPFCHTGRLIGGMASGCPINNLIPEWNDLVFRGLWKEALDRFDRDRRLADTQNTGAFARGRAYAARKLRKIICLMQSLERLAPQAAIDKIVPLGDQVVDGTA